MTKLARQKAGRTAPRRDCADGFWYVILVVTVMVLAVVTRWFQPMKVFYSNSPDAMGLQMRKRAQT